ncbi:MAG: hypothetical protein H0T52_08875, partial [Lautropia sp.]|nr:hypothetical protein [Lautropia sp.]
SYTADAQVGGKIAQIGSRLVESVAAKIADDFFKAFEARMTAPVAPGAAPDDLEATVPAVATGDTGGRPASTFDHVVGKVAQPQPAGGGSTVWWIAGIIILALLIYFFTR